MPGLSLKEVRKQYGKTPVIFGVDIDIQEGEFIVIVGPSGCGKSTLLRMVAGLEEISSGEICIDRKRVNELEPMERNIAMVFQNYALYPHMTVYDNMAYGLKIAKMPKAEIDTRIEVAAAMLQLTPYLQRKPKALSGGQRQRVAMGRAIVRQPDIFLFDEPLSNLDAKLRVQMRLEIKALQRELGITSLYVTHDQVEAMTLADRMIVMNQGHVEQIGRPMDVYENPASIFVAEFIGSPPMNIMPGSDVKLDRPFVGVRPEHLFRAVSPETSQFSAVVKGFEALGAETLVYLVTASGKEICVRQDGRDPVPDSGVELHLGYEEAYLCYFDG